MLNHLGRRTGLLAAVVLQSAAGFAADSDGPERVNGAAGQILLDARTAGPGFQTMFNGKDLSGWDGNPKLWSVKDGAITGQTTKENPATVNTFLIWTNHTVGDFELRCQFKLTANNDKGFANSGIQYRSKVIEPKTWTVGGYQADMEAGPNYTGILYEERCPRQIMAARGEKVVWDKDCKKQVTGSLGSSAELQAAIKPGDWNHYTIIAQGNHLQHFVNGKQTVDVTDECEGQRAMTGILALQLHVGQPMTAQFKDLQIKPLPAPPKTPANAAATLDGSWQVVSGEQNGESVPPDAVTNLTVVIKGNAYTVLKDGETQDKGTFTVDASKNPKQMDIHPETGDAAGKTLKAIFEASDNTMRVCYVLEAPERPTNFTAPPDSGRLLLTYKRNQ